ncbi:MAG: hypothetical protein AVDCRST_MAG12-2803, partial [uncultured Rubrobacteraceae bacterium]
GAAKRDPSLRHGRRLVVLAHRGGPGEELALAGSEPRFRRDPRP